MVAKVIASMAIGGGLGFSYHLLMKAVGSQ